MVMCKKMVGITKEMSLTFLNSRPSKRSQIQYRSILCGINVGIGVINSFYNICMSIKKL